MESVNSNSNHSSNTIYINNNIAIVDESVLFSSSNIFDRKCKHSKHKNTTLKNGDDELLDVT